MWVILALVWIITLYAAYALGVRRLTKLVLKELSKNIEQNRKHSQDWTRVNNKYVRDLAKMTLSDDATLQQRHLKVLAQNRLLRSSNKILARKYKELCEATKKKPIKDRLEDMSLLVTYMYEHMRRNK